MERLGHQFAPRTLQHMHATRVVSQLQLRYGHDAWVSPFLEAQQGGHATRRCQNHSRTSVSVHGQHDTVLLSVMMLLGASILAEGRKRGATTGAAIKELRRRMHWVSSRSLPTQITFDRCCPTRIVYILAFCRVVGE